VPKRGRGDLCIHGMKGNSSIVSVRIKTAH
jgi:hypothetical protein